MKPDDALIGAGQALGNLTLHLSWEAFLGIAAIAIVCTAVGAAIAAYGAQRGQNQANAADRIALLDHLRAAKNVEAEIDAAKQFQALLREKLEELVKAIFAHREEFAWCHSQAIRGKDPSPEKPQIQALLMLQAMYFPELQQVFREYSEVYDRWIRQVYDISESRLGNPGAEKPLEFAVLNSDLLQRNMMMVRAAIQGAADRAGLNVIGPSK